MKVEYKATIKNPEKYFAERILPKGVQDLMVKSALKEAYKLNVSEVLVISLEDMTQFMNIRHNKNSINFSLQNVYDSLDRLRVSGEAEYDKERSCFHELKYKVYGVR